MSASLHRHQCTELGVGQSREPACAPHCANAPKLSAEEHDALIFIDDTLAFLGVMFVVCVLIFIATVATTSYLLYSSDFALRELIGQVVSAASWAMEIMERVTP